MKKVAILLLLATLLLCTPVTAFAQTQMAPAATQNSIVQIASGEDNLKTFGGAVDAAGLRDKLSGTGPYTVFAPTDDAFNAIPASEMNTLMTDKPRMAAVMNNHVVPGRYTIKDLRNMGTVTTLDGKTLTLQSSNGAFAVDGAHIVKNNVPAGNGIIHVVDTVMMPK